MRFRPIRQWQPDSASTAVSTFVAPGGERLTVAVLEPDIVRVTMWPEGRPRLDRTWMIVDAKGEMPPNGRLRADLSPFSTPPVAPAHRPDTVSWQTERLQVQLDLARGGMSWRDENGRLFAADQPGRAYARDLSSRDVFHYLLRQPGEQYVGFGEKSGLLNKHGRRLRMFSVDALAYNAETSDPLYKHFPFYITVVPELNVAYGLLYDNFAITTFDMGSEIDNYYAPYRQYVAEDGDVDYYLIWGPTVAEVVQKLARLTGRPFLPPRWSLGFIMSAWSPSEQPDAQKQLMQMVDQFAAEQFPCSGYQLSSGYTVASEVQQTAGVDVENDRRYVFNWHNGRFPDPQGMSQHFHQAGIFLMANIKPAMLPSHPHFAEVAAAKGFVWDSEIDAPYLAHFWGGEGAHLDFTNPFTYGWWQEQVQRQLLKYGIDCTWNDNNEYTLWDDDAQCDGFGQPTRAGMLRPVQGLLMSQASHQAQIAYAPEKRPFLISRSGCVGIQRYAQTWSGDNHTSWHTLQFNIPMGLGMSLSNAGNYGHDVGGFVGANPDPELLVRWVQSGIFHPRFNMHSLSLDASYTSPWMHPEVKTQIRELFEWRYQMTPLWYNLLVEAHQTGAPPIRPLLYQFPHDTAAHHQSFAWMVGDTLLVAPVYRPGVSDWAVYLPRLTADAAGWWQHFYTGEWFAGGQTVTVAAPLSQVPLFVREGAILPFGEVHNLADATQDRRRVLHLYPHRHAGRSTMRLVEDDGVSLGFWQGKVTVWELTLETTAEQITLTADKVQDGYELPYERLEIKLPDGEKRQFTFRQSSP